MGIWSMGKSGYGLLSGMNVPMAIEPVPKIRVVKKYGLTIKKPPEQVAFYNLSESNKKRINHRYKSM